MGRSSKFYADECVTRAVIRGLQQRGVDVLTAVEAGMLGASDEEQVTFALVQGRVIFTQDDDFLRLHAAGVEHAGIVYASQQTPMRDIIFGLMLIYQVLDAEDMAGHVEYL